MNLVPLFTLAAGAVLWRVLPGVHSVLEAVTFYGSIALWLIFRERYGRHYLKAAPGLGWSATPEKFVDAKTRQLVSVYYEPASGRRAYVIEAAP